MKMKKILFSNLALISLVASPLMTIVSCSDGSNDSSKQTLEEFIVKNENNLIVPDKDNVKDFPTILYIDNASTSLESFKLNIELQKILDDLSIKANFVYDVDQPSGNRIRFNLTFSQNGKTILESQSIMSGFINRTEYISKSRQYLQSLNLNESIKNQYNLKEFLKSQLPLPGQQNEWYNLLDFNVPWGFDIQLNNDIQSSRYDSNNQKLIIGTFTSQLGSNESFKEDIAISITNNFLDHNRPLFVFIVSDSGISKSDISAETLFINRTTNDIIKFNDRFNNTAIYGELDFSTFRHWELPTNNEIGAFSGNYITSVKLPQNTTEIIPKIFLNNKILIFDTNNAIDLISDDSFD
ncbi:MAG: hypothetical protein ACRCXE_02145, partial [Metamycoplasmataceae bacterium]